MSSLLYTCFFALFPATTILIDLSLLFPQVWPPRSLAPLRQTIDWWKATYDPLMSQAPVWLKAMTLVEAGVIPAYSVFALRALKQNAYPSWMVPLTVAFTTVCVYSVFVIGMENYYGLGRSFLDKGGFLWLLAYAPFVLVPVFWTMHVLDAVANRGTVRSSRKVMASISKRLSSRANDGGNASRSSRIATAKPNAKAAGSITKSAHGELNRRLTPTTHEARLLVAEADMRTPITTRSGAQVRSTRKTTASATKTRSLA